MPNLDDKDFIVNVGPNSTFRKSGTFQTVPEDIDKMFLNFEQKEGRKITLYFHGGLVTEIDGLKTAQHVAPYLLNSGSAPVCFVWETGLVETISTNLAKISETKLFNKLLKILLKKVTEKLGFDSPFGRGIAGKGLSDDEIEYELSQPDPFNSFNRSAPSEQSRSAINIDSIQGREVFLEAELNRELKIMIENDPEFVATINQTKLTVDAVGNNTGARGFVSVSLFVSHVVKIAFRIISRFVQKRDHDLYPTIIEEILREFYVAELGAWVWKAMKDKAAGMWESNAGREGLNQYVGRYFLEKLAAYKKKYPDTIINLVGHSAGSIVICNLLKYASSLEASFSFNHIIFMAPACRVDIFKKELLDNPSRYNDIRIYTLSDDYECKDKLVPYFYTHSLLFLVAGILEDEGDSYDAYILGLQRHIGFKNPYDIPLLKDTHDFINEADKNRISLAVSINGTGVGLETHAESHGGFDDDVTTLKSIQYFLQQ